MLINGLQKLTLLDYPGHTACTVFTGGCNFRCPFCHNASLVARPAEQPVIPEEEILAFLKKRQGLLDGVCITGGEPTLNRDLPDFIKRIKDLGYLVKLDTNGYAPETLRSLIDAGLIDYAAMDIKSSRERYAAVAGVPGLDVARVEESVRMLMEGRIPYEFRTTVVEELHSVEDFGDIGQWLRGTERYFIQVFRDSGDILGGEFSAPDREKLAAMLDSVRKYIPSAQLRGVD